MYAVNVESRNKKRLKCRRFAWSKNESNSLNFARTAGENQTVPPPLSTLLFLFDHSSGTAESATNSPIRITVRWCLFSIETWCVWWAAEQDWLFGTACTLSGNGSVYLDTSDANGGDWHVWNSGAFVTGMNLGCFKMYGPPSCRSGKQKKGRGKQTITTTKLTDVAVT